MPIDPLNKKEVGVRSGKATLAIAGIVMAALLGGALPAAAQYDDFEQPGLDVPLKGYTRSDGTVVLTDEAFCSFLLAALFGDRQLTFAELIDGTKKQKKARAGAFVPATDAATLGRCAEVIRAYRESVIEGDPIAEWARSSPVVPEALALLLPPDYLADPLAQPKPIGQIARTSGFGDYIGAPFGLTGGTYFAEVDSEACASWSGSIVDARDPSTSHGPVADRAYLYDVEPAHYYWDIDAPDCDWTVDLVPVELGPEPTATPAPRAVVPKLFGDGWTRVPGAANPGWLTATEAREAVLAAGLTTGTCTEEEHPPIGPNRVWQQDPAPGTLLEMGSPVDVWMTSECAVYSGERVALP